MSNSTASPAAGSMLPAVQLPMGYVNFVLLLAASKGGTGKSTLAIHLAVAGACAGLATVIIDADSTDDQCSCLGWFKGRSQPNPQVKRASITKVDAAINWAKEAGYALIIIDTGGRDVPALPRLLDIADFMMTPAQPSPLDLKATKSITRIWPTSSTPASVVLNGVGNENTARARHYRERYASEGKIMPDMVHRRVQYVDAIAAGMGVSEYLPGGAGDREMRSLLNAAFAAALRRKVC